MTPEENFSVNCPICNKAVLWCASSHYRPFCSNRCKLIDLGEWATEERIITASETPDHEQWSETPGSELRY